MTTQHLIDTDQPLSKSLLWQIQRQYFLKNGMAAWQDDVVPHQISSSPYMARAYADIALAYLDDVADDIDVSQPLYIIELGAGSGRLAYHFLRHFFTQLDDAVKMPPIKMILTDFVPEIVEFWQENGRFQPYVEAGQLDFALFDAMDKRPLIPINNPSPINPAETVNPIILIANYFFDSIPQDSFLLDDGVLCSNLLSLYSTQPEPNLADPSLWQRLRLAYDPIPQAPPYYENPLYDEILQLYADNLPDTAFSFPNVGLDCLRFWQADGRGLLLTSDRGHTNVADLIGQGDPEPNLHGSFSLMVNYDAIARYVEWAGGMALHAPQYQDNLQTAVYLFGHHPHTEATARAFARAITATGPDDFFALKQAIAPHVDGFTLPQLLSYLRLSVYDADVFADCFPALLARVQEADPVWYADVEAVAMAVWAQYLPLADDDLLEGQIDQLLTYINEKFADYADDAD